MLGIGVPTFFNDFDKMLHGKEAQRLQRLKVKLIALSGQRAFVDIAREEWMDGMHQSLLLQDVQTCNLL